MSEDYYADMAAQSPTVWKERAKKAEAERDRLAAQCAAMREALRAFLADMEEVFSSPGNLKMALEMAEKGRPIVPKDGGPETIRNARAALTDDGKALLEVVEAAKIITTQDTGDIWTEDHGWVRPIKPETVCALETALARMENRALEEPDDE